MAGQLQEPLETVQVMVTVQEETLLLLATMAL
jgi:hypothetical protein